MNFYDRDDCIILSNHIDDYGTQSGIFLFKNFIPKDLLNKIESQFVPKQENTRNENTLISWYSDKTIPTVDGTLELWEKISELLSPGWVIHPMASFLRTHTETDGMFIHADSPGKGMCHLLSQTDMFATCCELDYGVVAYLGDFEGGEVFYPSIDKNGVPRLDSAPDADNCFEYAVKKGDLIIHSAFKPYEHGTRQVTSGERYAFACFCLKKEDNPGTFYNYDTPEYHSQLGNRTLDEIRAWSLPLKENPQFSKEKVKIMKKSGLEGTALAEEFFSDMLKD